MGLIRGIESVQLARDAVVLNLGDLRRQGEELISLAKAEAAEIVSAARAERERLIAGATEKGFAEGREAGLEQGRLEGAEKGRSDGIEQFRQMFSRLDSAWAAALEEFSKSRDEMLSQARADALSLAIEIARRVTKRVVEIDPKVVAAQLDAALGMVLRSTRLIVYVNPEDRAEADGALPELLSRFADKAHAELIDDASLSRGSALVRTERGEIDATIETQLERIVSAVRPASSAGAASALAPAPRTAGTPAADEAGGGGGGVAS